jgi:hypothetical protein
MPDTRDGRIGDHVMLAPPFIASEAELADATQSLHRVIRAVI